MATKMTAAKRETGKPHSALTDLRGEGNVPGVVYGYKMETTSIVMSEIDLIKTLRESGRNGVISLEIDGKSTNVVLSDYQMDSLKGNFKHVDFLAINMSEEIDVDATVHVIGESAGEKEGGVVTQPNREVHIRVKPNDIPDSVDIDVSELEIGDSVSVSDIRDKFSFEILNDDDFLLISVTAPRTEEEMEELETADEGEEPEVIGDNEDEAAGEEKE
ncbi:50S ribosomal protein L25/general stress protein Ctc [Planococcus maritimus]|uniref:Large ribosomal subunit protein bL25 n=1 Tax=Planococcus maritimus TaxID=192421 RepID=A0A7D7RHP7_PLAMR|nr:50S ribosomal protein L25/general stress protein Ctc [Planococcus maritimus]KYG58638.1 50S ribosomal protein L25/general stress protein Ctc [Planococcus maritimus]QMT17523.1 50S ribosomal protein L25/general stress protein Ctc [Planococcus maritimus]